MTTSTLSHSFNVAYATEFKSIDLALLIHHLQYWIHHNKRLKRNYHEGRTWMFDTMDSIAAHFPYWSRDQVNRLLRKAVKLKIIVKGNFNKTKFDRTVWYAFADENKFGISQISPVSEQPSPTPFGEIAKSDLAKSPNGFDEIARPIPHTKTDTKTNDSLSAPAEEGENFFRFGTKIKMKQKEYEDFVQAYSPDFITKLLQEMDDYLSAHGKSYKNYAAALRTFISKRKESKGGEAMESNETFAKKIAENYNQVRAPQRQVRLDAMNGRLEIYSTHPTSTRPATVIKYSENGFKDQVEHALRKWGLK